MEDHGRNTPRLQWKQKTLEREARARLPHADTASGAGGDYRTASFGVPPNRPKTTSITAPTVMPQSARLNTG